MKTECQRLTRREMVEKLLAGIAAGALWPMLAPAHPMREHLTDAVLLDRADAFQKGSDWKPLFLSSNQNEALAALSESILPGSGQAQVNRFIDLLLSVESEDDRAKFVTALTNIDSGAQKAFGRSFQYLTTEERDQTLTTMSNEGPNRKDFDDLKEWITIAYYSSEEGMRELGWAGKHAFRALTECDRGH